MEGAACSALAGALVGPTASQRPARSRLVFRQAAPRRRPALAKEARHAQDASAWSIEATDAGLQSASIVSDALALAALGGMTNQLFKKRIAFPRDRRSRQLAPALPRGPKTWTMSRSLARRLRGAAGSPAHAPTTSLGKRSRPPGRARAKMCQRGFFQRAQQIFQQGDRGTSLRCRSSNTISTGAWAHSRCSQLASARSSSERRAVHPVAPRRAENTVVREMAGK